MLRRGERGMDVLLVAELAQAGWRRQHRQWKEPIVGGVKRLWVDEKERRYANEHVVCQKPSAEPPPKNRTRSAVAEPAKTPDAGQASPGARYLRQQEFDVIVERLRAVAHQAAAGDDQAMDRLRAELDAVPWLPRMLGDLNRDIEEALIQAVAADDPLKAECIRRRASELRGKLCQANAAVLTKLAVGRVVSAWLLVQFAELRLIKDPDAPRLAKQLDHLQCSYTQALRALSLAIKLDVFQREAEQRFTKVEQRR